ncbi:MAG: MurR/RpiR family transcriptional regulator [Anaerolineales bacterium]|nr:MurR/RpiR family transcriptional regulator [Anaerolineales bacterium]
MDQTDSLKDRIAKSLDTLSPRHKRIARFVLDHPYFTSYASANQVGEKNDTTAATVVRFAQALNYEGFSDLQKALQTQLPHILTTKARMQQRLNTEHPPASNSQQVFYTDMKNIERTANKLSETDLNNALDAILKARRILIIGAGISHGPLIFLAHSLKVMGFEVISIDGEGLQSAVELAGIKPDDLLIAIDLWRYVRMTANAANIAKEKGTPVIAITDSIVSPLAQMADIAFEIASEGIVHSLSVTALMSLLNVFIAMLADRVPEKVYQSLKFVDESYEGNDLLIMA